MVVCHYFLQGRCHFGQNCRNEHIYDNSSGQNYHENSTGRLPGNIQVDNMIRQISKEVLASEKGGQWPLSCFAPLKGGTCLPWWEDISPEEVRWKMYEARKNCELAEAMHQIKLWHKKAEDARNLLKQPTSEVIHILYENLKGKKPTQSTTTTGDGFASSVNDVKTSFRFDTSINKLFVNSANQGSNSGNIFGNTSSGFQSQNIFGRPGQSLSPNNTSNIFSRPEQSSQSIFSNPVKNVHNIFSGQTPNQVFPNSDMSGQKIFQPQNQPQMNLFTSSPSSAFGAPNPIADNTKMSTNIFGNAQNNPFQLQNANPPQGAEANSAESGAATAGNASGKDTDLSVYSKIEDLTEEELKSFSSTTFTFGKIPLKPPPREFC